MADGTGIVSPWGTTSSAYGEDVTADAARSVLVTGKYGGRIDLNPDPKKNGFLTSTNEAASDAFVMKLTAGGVYACAGSMGGRGYDLGLNVAVDGGGNVYVNGRADVDAEGDFDPGRGRLAIPAGGFLIKLDPGRNLLWGTGGVGAGGLAVDAAGAVADYTRSTFSDTFDADPGARVFNVTTAGQLAVLVTQLDVTGRFVQASALAGPGYHHGVGIAVDGRGNVFMIGSLRGTVDFESGEGMSRVDCNPSVGGEPGADGFLVQFVPGV